MATFKGRSSEKPDKPEWECDHGRIIRGEPYTTRGWSDAQKARHLNVVIPEPVHEREFFPEQKDVYPSGLFERRAVLVDGAWQFYWFDIRYAERMGMAEFRRKPMCAR